MVFMSQQEAQPTTGLPASFRQWVEVGLQWLFPPRCAGCGRVDTPWCDNCQQRLEAVPYHTAIQPHPPLAAVATTALHTGAIQQAIWSLKYENGLALAQPLASRLAHRLAGLNWTFDTVVPVPLHTTRLRERGYNQSQVIAEILAQQLQLRCEPAALTRQRYTQAQVGLNAQERQVNMLAAFAADPQLISNQTLLFIDDVFTTGATLAACAQAALDAGAQGVYALTLTSAQS